MPSIKHFAENRSKWKGFLTQVKIQINNERLRLPIPLKKITYTEMYLTGKPFKWFQLYLAKAQVNGAISTNKEMRDMFLLQEGFSNRLTQIYGDVEEKKLQ